MSTNDKSLLDASEAAEWLGLSTSTLAKMRLTGSGPVYSKLGRRVVYLRQDLADWVAAHRCRSTSEYTAARG